MPMMRLNDLDITGFTDGARRQLYQPETQVDADTHVRGKHDGYVRRSRFDLRPLRSVETGCTDHDALTVPPAPLHVGQGCVRQCKVDHHLHIVAQVFFGWDTLSSNAGNPPGIRPRQVAFRPHRRRDQLNVIPQMAGLHQRRAHPSVHTGNTYLNHSVVECHTIHGSLSR
ncbi:MAG: hypothetical protein MAG794_00787 [Gammaproteobacteria bacterium]|nr:hypothetical protein [Gammaproteobacteria bacterium]